MYLFDSTVLNIPVGIGIEAAVFRRTLEDGVYKTNGQQHVFLSKYTYIYIQLS